MAENPSVHDIGDDDRGRLPDTTAASGIGPPPTDQRIGAPRWVKVFGIVGAVLVVLVVVMLLTGHGPGRHMNGALSAHATPALMTATLTAFGA